MLWIGLFIGILVGLSIGLAIGYEKSVGTICVYPNDEDGEPYRFLVLERDVGYLLHKKRAVLKIEERQNPNDARK